MQKRVNNMNHESTTKTRSGERKPKVTRPDDSKDYTYSIGVGVSVGGANKGGLDAALKRYVGARPALKYAEDMASKTIDIENDTGVYAQMYRTYLFKGLCASLLEQGIRSECMYGAHYVSASDADGNVGFSRLFLALALNSESEKSLKPNTQIAR